MLDKNASKPSIDLGDLGGRQISSPVVPVKTENPISLADIGGIPLDARVALEQPKDDTD